MFKDAVYAFSKFPYVNFQLLRLFSLIAFISNQLMKKGEQTNI